MTAPTVTPLAGETGDGLLQEPLGGDGTFVVEDLDVGEAGGVVDGDIDELPADAAVAVAARAATGGPVTSDVEPAQLLHVDVQ